MSQTQFLREFDAQAINAFLDAGIADAAMYQPNALAPAVACNVLVDRNVRDFGDDAAPVATSYTLITFQRAQVQPVRGGLVTLGAEVFVLDAEVRQDESSSRWVVANG